MRKFSDIVELGFCACHKSVHKAQKVFTFFVLVDAVHVKLLPTRNNVFGGCDGVGGIFHLDAFLLRFAEKSGVVDDPYIVYRNLLAADFP